MGSAPKGVNGVAATARRKVVEKSGTDLRRQRAFLIIFSSLNNMYVIVSIYPKIYLQTNKQANHQSQNRFISYNIS